VPRPLDDALWLRRRPNARIVRAGDRHWRIFEDLCLRTQAQGALIADAPHAALAIEHGCDWISFDRDFARFPICAGATRWTERRARLTVC
jgi:predicted nucleic acid-binding protein